MHQNFLLVDVLCVAFVFRAALYAIDSKLGLGLGKDFEN